jgi:hypothetical protein
MECLILSLLSGVLAGIIASLIFWYFVNYWLSPNIRLSEKISKFKSEDGTCYLYRIKVSNNSRFRDVYSVKTYYTFGFTNGSTNFTIDAPFIPLLSKRKMKHRSEKQLSISERQLSIDVSQIKKWMQGCQYNTLCDFFENDGVVAVTVVCNDRFDGAKTYRIKRFTKDDIIEGKFISTSMNIEKAVDDNNQLAIYKDSN